MSESQDNTVVEPEIILQFDELNDDEKLLINDTIDQIQKIVEDATLSVIERVGELILSKIFENNCEIAGEINLDKSNSPKIQLMKTLSAEIEKAERGVALPKKTWLYNAVKIVLDRKSLETMEGYDKYKQLSHSHKIELLTVEEANNKLEYAKETIDNKLSVRELRALIKNKKFLPPSRGLMFYLRNPSKIINPEDVKITKHVEKVDALAVGKKSISALEQEINDKQDALEKLQKLYKRLEN